MLPASWHARPWLPLAAIALAMLGAACARPDVRVICHNANCAGAPDPARDDTMEALEESLALEYRGQPTIDGIEVDLFWEARANGGAGRCIFAHDLDSVAADPPAAAEPIAIIAAHIERPAPISWNGERFDVRMELKGFVGGSWSDKHTPEQARQHAECALDQYATLAAAARRAGRDIDVIFDSANPDVLKAVIASPRWPGGRIDRHVRARLSADFVDPTPSGLSFQRLSDFPEQVDDAVFHSNWVRDGSYQAFRSLGMTLTIWMFSATVETFDAIERLEPEAALTSEAELMRRWLQF